MLQRTREQFFNIRRDEWPRALALSAFFFLVIAIFWVIKPIKQGVLISYYGQDALHLFGMTFGGAETAQIARFLNMVVVYGIVILFTILSRHLKRQQLVYFFCGTLSLLLIYFGWAVQRLTALDAWSLYIFGDIFNSIMVVTFWAFTNDVNSPNQSKRLYGIIGLGGVIGGFVGATFVSVLVEDVGRAPLITGGVIGLVLIAAIAWYVNRRAGGVDHPAATATEGQPSVNAAIEGARLVFKSKYLLAILGILALYEVTSNIITFQYEAMAEMYVPAGPEKDAFFATVGQWIGIVSIVVQLLLRPYMLNRFGVGAALMVLPLADLILSIGFLLVPVLLVAAAMTTADNALNYSINQSSKEALYTPTSQDAKYKAKAFIDMFMQRGAKVAAGFLALAFVQIVSLEAVHWLSIATVIVLVAWIAVVRYAGKRFKEESEKSDEGFQPA